MKKREIVKRVEASVEKQLPKVISDVARGRAYSEVSRAMYEQEERDEPKGESPASEAKEHGANLTHEPRKGRTVVNPTDPRISGSR